MQIYYCGYVEPFKVASSGGSEWNSHPCFECGCVCVVWGPGAGTTSLATLQRAILGDSLETDYL